MGVFNNPLTRSDTRKMLIISLFCLVTVGIHSGEAHAFKRLSAYGKYGNNENDWTKMLGEVFFKQGEVDIDRKDNDLSLAAKEYETLPYEVIKQYETFEQRYYPEAIFVCNKTKNIDTVADPFAGLENMSPFSLMSSKRWRQHHTSHMFQELFKYISGVNQNQEEMEMTIPVVTTHDIVKEDPLGNYEDQEMCFYLPSQYQENHTHKEDEGSVSFSQEERQARHEKQAAPSPLNSKVYLKTRPAMYIFARRFGGFPLTHDQWEKQRLALEADLLVGKLKYKSDEYMTVGYDNPWKLVKRRNEVWMQCLEAAHALPAPVTNN